MSKLTYTKIKQYIADYLEVGKKTKGKKGKKRSFNNDQRKLVYKIIIGSVVFLGVILVVGLIGFGVMVFVYSKELPPPGKPFSKDIAQNTNIYDKNGVLLASIHGDVSREWVKLPDIGHNMKWAMLAAEDINFYNEPGIDIFSIVRAGFRDIFSRGSSLQGGSTITQQLVKNTELTDQQTFQRKIKEIILTLEVERQYSKDQILEAYINQIPFGGDSSGIKVASETYFGVEPSQLDLAQSAFLAGLPQAPSYYSPIVDGADPILSDGNRASTDRAYYVLNEMLKHNDLTGVTSAQVDAAKKEILTFQFNTSNNNYKAPHFVEYVKEQLEKTYGAQKVEEGGLQVYTTLDYNIQQLAEQEITKEFNDFAKVYRFNGDDAAMVSIDPKTGEILAMVGSPPGQTDINIITSPTGVQPGSSIKPFMYMSAFKDLGMSPTTFMPDIPISISNYQGYTYPSPYAPENFTGKTGGPMNIDQALNVSLNIPAVETLYSLTPAKFIADLQNYGYEYTWDSIGGSTSDFFKQDHSKDLSYAIGGENVVFLDHVNAYAMLANEGTLYPPTSILKVTDSTGKVLYQYDPTSVGQKVIDGAYPYMINKMLEKYKYLVNDLSVFDPKLLNSGYDIAGKTGTNNTTTSTGAEGNASSLTFVGYTPDIVSGFWYGNEQYQGKPLENHGSYIPEGEYLIKYWGDYMDKVLPKFPKDQFERPSDIVNATVCSDTGLLAVDGKTVCPNTTQALFQKDQLPKVDDAHVQEQVCPSDQTSLATPDMIAANESVAKIFTVLKTYDPTFQSALDQYMQNILHVSNSLPTSYCTGSGTSFLVDITSPADQAEYSPGGQVNVNAIIVSSGNTISSANIYFNNSNVGAMTSTSSSNYSGSFTIPSGTSSGSYQLTIKAIDSTGAESDKSITLNVGAQPTPTNNGNGNVTITSPQQGQVVVPNVNTKLSLAVGGIDPHTVTSAYFNVFSGNKQLNSSPITATENSSNSNEWDSTYTFPVSSNGYKIVAYVQISGQQNPITAFEVVS